MKWHSIGLFASRARRPGVGFSRQAGSSLAPASGRRPACVRCRGAQGVAARAPGREGRRDAMMRRGLLVFALAVSGCVHGDDPRVSLDPDEFIATARLPDDLRLELAASEPAVVGSGGGRLRCRRADVRRRDGRLSVAAGGIPATGAGQAAGRRRPRRLLRDVDAVRRPPALPDVGPAVARRGAGDRAARHRPPPRPRRRRRRRRARGALHRLPGRQHAAQRQRPHLGDRQLGVRGQRRQPRQRPSGRPARGRGVHPRHGLPVPAGHRRAGAFVRDHRGARHRLRRLGPDVRHAQRQPRPAHGVSHRAAAGQSVAGAADDPRHDLRPRPLGAALPGVERRDPRQQPPTSPGISRAGRGSGTTAAAPCRTPTRAASS